MDRNEKELLEITSFSRPLQQQLLCCHFFLEGVLAILELFVQLGLHFCKFCLN